MHPRGRFRFGISARPCSARPTCGPSACFRRPPRRHEDAWSGLPLAGQRAALRRRRGRRARWRARQAPHRRARRCHRARLGPRHAARRAGSRSASAARARALPAWRSTGRASWASSTSRPTASPTAACIASAAGRHRARPAARRRRAPTSSTSAANRRGPAPSRAGRGGAARASCRCIEGLRARTRGADLDRHAQGRGDAPRRRRRRRHPQRRLGADARPRRAATSPPRPACRSS